MAWGGSRRGAGRPRNPIKRIGRTFRLSDEEFLSLKPLIIDVYKRQSLSIVFLGWQQVTAGVLQGLGTVSYTHLQSDLVRC